MRTALVAVFAMLAALDTAAAGDLDVRVTDAGGKALSNAVIFAVPESAAALPMPRPGKIDQLNREYVPLVSVVQVGAAVSFPNSDNIRHHVYSFSPARVFSIKLYSGKPAEPIVFDKPGLVVLGCNIHDQMVAWLLVVPTPWFATSPADGNVRLTELPAGRYQLYAWHPGLTGEPEGRLLQMTATQSRSESIALDVAPVPRLAGAGRP